MDLVRRVSKITISELLDTSYTEICSQHLLKFSSTDQAPEVCIIELGGTIGDIESMHFVEAFRQFEFRIGKENFLNMHVSLVPTPSSGEQKTKERLRTFIFLLVLQFLTNNCQSQNNIKKV